MWQARVRKRWETSRAHIDVDGFENTMWGARVPGRMSWGVDLHRSLWGISFGVRIYAIPGSVTA
jgi:hypothetical protein